MAMFSSKSALKVWGWGIGALRLAAGLLVAWAGALRPFTLAEALVPLWPPRLPLNLWLARVWLAPWQRWDVDYYLRILTQGYSLSDGTAQFHPLYPLLAWPLVQLGLDPLLALLLVATGAAWLALVLLTLWWEPFPLSRMAPALLIAPFALFWLLPYTEPLFLVWALLTFLALRRGRWGWAGVCAALATLTRQQGIVLLLPIAWELWQHRHTLRWWAWSSLLAAPVAWLGWIAYRAWALGDWQPQVTSLQGAVYSILISPAAHQVVPEQEFLWPWEALRRACLHFIRQPDLDMGINFTLGGVLLVLLALAWKRLTVGEKLYSVAIVGVSLAYATGPVHPYMGLPRHMFLAFPLLRGVEVVTRRRWLRLLWAGLGVLSLIVTGMAYALHAWVP